MRPDCPVPRFLVRQSLLDGDCRVAGFELSLRSRTPVPVLPGAESEAQARDEALLTHVADMESSHVLSGRVVLLDLSPQAWDNPMLRQMPSGKLLVPVGIEVPDAAALERAMREAGVVPMFDDDGASEPALPGHCDTVRLDFAGADAITLSRRVDRFRSLGARQLVARGVDSLEAFEAGRRFGFDLFQGDFLFHTPPSARSAMEAGVMQVMDLLNKTLARVPLDELETGFKQDAGLSYRLLRYINSPANGLDQPMQSIGHALMWLGHDQLYRWLSVLLFSGAAATGRGDALLRNALVRARFMEKLGSARLERSQRGGLFIVGVLSLLDSLLGQTMAEALAPLNLPPAMTDALLKGLGPYAPYLALSQASERFDQETIAAIAREQGLSEQEVNLAHVDALIWSETLES